MAEKKKRGGIGLWFREMRSELKKVVWPTWTQVYKNTWIVLVMCAIFAVITFIMDYALTAGVGLLLKI